MSDLPRLTANQLHELKDVFDVATMSTVDHLYPDLRALGLIEVGTATGMTSLKRYHVTKRGLEVLRAHENTEDEPCKPDERS